MAITTGKLTALRITRLSEPGMYADGGGLYLQIKSAAAKSWIFRYRLAGKSRAMGLGSIDATPLAIARELAGKHRAQRQQRIDPIAARKAARESKALEAAKATTFSEAATRYVASKRAEWKNEKHAAQWEATLTAYAKPVIGALPVQDIDTTLVLKVLEPIWSAKPETASLARL